MLLCSSWTQTILLSQSPEYLGLQSSTTAPRFIPFKNGDTEVGEGTHLHPGGVWRTKSTNTLQVKGLLEFVLFQFLFCVLLP